MVEKKRKLGSENIETVHESKGRQRPSHLAPAGRPRVENLDDVNEQLRTEVEELRRQVLELHEGKDQDDRSIRGAEWLARIAEENPDPVLQVSKHGAVQYRNPASFPLCRQWNPSDELIVPPAIYKLVQAAYARTKVIRQEMTFGKHTYLITVAPAPARADYVNIFASDITARKQAEEEMRLAKERYARLFHVVREGFAHYQAIYDDQRKLMDLLVLEINPAGAELSGVAPERQIGRTWRQVWPDVDEKLFALYQKVDETGEPLRFDNHSNPTGRIYDIAISKAGPGEFIVTFRDITERKQAEQEVRENAARLALALSGTQTGMYRRDLTTGETLCTEPTTRLLGLRTTTTTTLSQSYHYHDWVERVHPEDLPRVEAELRRCRTERVPYELEYRVIWSDDSVHWLADRGVFQYEPESRPTRVLGILLDVTARKRAEESLRELTATLEARVAERTGELRRRAKQLQKLTLEMSEAEERERKRLAEILHDDLQQLMAGAKFHVNLIRNRLKHDAVLQDLAAEVDHTLKEAIEKSRNLSHELSPAVSHHGDFAEALDWLAGQMQAKHGLAVHVHGTGELPVQSDAVKTFAYRTAQELLFNTVKHAQVKEASVRVRRCGPYLCLSVSDRGRGFDPQGLRDAGGFGLLSIRERIELLGGRMKIRSAPGRGSTFFVVVPDGEEPDDRGQKTEDGRQAKERTSSSVLRHPSSLLRVLLADDHQVVRQGLIALFSEESTVEVVGEASNGHEAVELVHQLHPDVVIMDVSMPVVNGEEATRRIKQDLPQTRIVALSMREEPEMRERMSEAGAESYVLKTAPYKELLAAIRGEKTDAER